MVVGVDDGLLKVTVNAPSTGPFSLPEFQYAKYAKVPRSGESH